MRTIIELPDDQVAALDAHCRPEGISRAEAIRRAVDAYLREGRSGAGDAAFGLWRGRVVDGLVHERRLRREWTQKRGR